MLSFLTNDELRNFIETSKNFAKVTEDLRDEALFSLLELTSNELERIQKEGWTAHRIRLLVRILKRRGCLHIGLDSKVQGKALGYVLASGQIFNPEYYFHQNTDDSKFCDIVKSTAEVLNKRKGADEDTILSELLDIMRSFKESTKERRESNEAEPLLNQPSHWIASETYTFSQLKDLGDGYAIVGTNNKIDSVAYV